MFIGAVCSLFSYFLILTYNYWKLVKTFLQGWGFCASFFFARRGIFSPKFPAREERLAISNKFPGGLPNGGVRAWNWFMHYRRGTNFKMWILNIVMCEFDTGTWYTRLSGLWPSPTATTDKTRLNQWTTKSSVNFKGIGNGMKCELGQRQYNSLSSTWNTLLHSDSLCRMSRHSHAGYFGRNGYLKWSQD